MEEHVFPSAMRHQGMEDLNDGCPDHTWTFCENRDCGEEIEKVETVMERKQWWQASAL